LVNELHKILYQYKENNSQERIVSVTEVLL